MGIRERTNEAEISEVYRATFRSTAADETCLTNVYSGRLTRVKYNRFAQALGPITKKAPQFPLGFAVSGPLRQAWEQKGSNEYGPYYCGQAVSLGQSGPAAELTRELGEGCFERIRAMPHSLDAILSENA